MLLITRTQAAGEAQLGSIRRELYALLTTVVCELDEERSAWRVDSIGARGLDEDAGVEAVTAA